jgi:hypothetical protein
MSDLCYIDAHHIRAPQGPGYQEDFTGGPALIINYYQIALMRSA